MTQPTMMVKIVTEFIETVLSTQSTDLNTPYVKYVIRFEDNSHHKNLTKKIHLISTGKATEVHPLIPFPSLILDTG